MKVLNKYFLKRILSDFGIGKTLSPKVGDIRFGDLYRTKPFSTRYGIDRGGAVDRVYIEAFLHENLALVKGRVLEVANNDYTKRFGGSNVTKSDVLHVKENHPNATIIADLSQPLTIEENQFDCIILTQTLQFIFDYSKAIENCYRLLKPGGHLLLTVPGITPLGRDPFDWYWSFTTYSVQRIMEEQFSKNQIRVQTFGNVLTASAFLYGMGKKEIGEIELKVNDPSFQVIIAVSAQK